MIEQVIRYLINTLVLIVDKAIPIGIWQITNTGVKYLDIKLDLDRLIASRRPP